MHAQKYTAERTIIRWLKLAEEGTRRKFSLIYLAAQIVISTIVPGVSAAPSAVRVR